jgi:hypothetical protein
MAGKRKLYLPIENNDSFQLARIDAIVRLPLFGHEKNSLSSLHAQC